MNSVTSMFICPREKMSKYVITFRNNARKRRESTAGDEIVV